MRPLFTCIATLIALSVTPIAIAQQVPSQQTSPSSSTQKEQQGVDRSIRSESDKSGTQEPSSASPAAAVPDTGAVYVNGTLNVPGSPKDSQTVPAKFSERNAALDKLPTMAQSLALTEAQRKTILASVRATNAPVEQRDAKLSEALPAMVEAHEFSPAIKSEIPTLTNLTSRQNPAVDSREPYRRRSNSELNAHSPPRSKSQNRWRINGCLSCA
jgi:hypothetical protein